MHYSKNASPIALNRAANETGAVLAIPRPENCSGGLLVCVTGTVLVAVAVAVELELEFPEVPLKPEVPVNVKLAHVSLVVLAKCKVMLLLPKKDPMP